VFTTQEFDQKLVEKLIPAAYGLKSRGGLAIIALGKVDQTRKYIPQLTDNYNYWAHPDMDPTPLEWEDFFWNQAYGCKGPAPSDVSTPGTEPTITLPTMPSNNLNWNFLKNYSKRKESIYVENRLSKKYSKRKENDL
jgi:hypothetical protein